MELEKTSDVQSIIKIFVLLLLDLTSFRCHLAKLQNVGRAWNGVGLLCISNYQDVRVNTRIVRLGHRAKHYALQ